MSSPDNTLFADKSILRAADIRGVAGVSLTPLTACLIGKAFGTVLIRKGIKICFVGGDGRLSTPMLSEALIQGLLSCGIDVINIGSCPTPMLYFAAHLEKNVGAIMVTASHNPKEYNGFKMMVDQESFCGKAIEDLGRLIDRQDFETGIGNLKHENFLNRYVNRLVQDFNFNGKPLKVVWDCGNAMAGIVVPSLINRLPGCHILLNKKIDGNFPVHPPDSSKAEYLTALSQTVVKEKADLGVAFDGDADRLGVITSDGNFLQTDHLLQIFAEDILKKNPDAVFIADIKTGKTFISEIKRMGGRPLIWKTGHSFIKKKMKETNALLGGEVSGHICFADKYFGFDDALYSAVRLLNIVANQKEESFLERIQRIPKTVISPEMEIFCPDDQKFQCVEKIKKILQDQQLSFDETDGIKYIYPSTGWWLLRASNTSERLICRCEADTIEEMEQLKKDLFHLLNTVYPVDLK